MEGRFGKRGNDHPRERGGGTVQEAHCNRGIEDEDEGARGEADTGKLLGQEIFWGVKCSVFGQEVPYYIVNIAYNTE